jgi:hypothetical protein
MSIRIDEFETPVNGCMKMRLPDFLIIGEMRCGTTTLWEMMDQHPLTGFPFEKELHFFDRRASAGLDWYGSHFNDISKALKAGEATPDYLYCSGVCERIKAVLPNVKLIVILRDPTERAWSHYWHNVRRGREPLSFAAALEQEAKRMKHQDDVGRAHFAYVSRGHYIRRLHHYEQVFGRDQLCIVFLEDLVSDPIWEVGRALKHVGLDPVDGIPSAAAPQRNRADYPRWPRLSAITSRLMREVRGNLILGPPASLAATLTRPLRTYSGRVGMPRDLRRSIDESFLQSDLELQDWLGRPVPWRSGKAHFASTVSTS